jgi:hypothetical protein
MKQLPFLCFLMSLVTSALAQEVVTVLPKDETGKYIYYEVVSDVKSADSLKARLLDFLAKNKKELKYKATNDKVTTAEGKMVINKSMAMMSHPSGEISYQFHFEVNGQKYRFWLTDFEFIPYQKDRYGNFVPSTTVGKPLEIEPKKLNAEQWEEYRLQAAKYATNFAQRLKDHLVNKVISPLPVVEKKVVSKSWK